MAEPEDLTERDASRRTWMAAERTWLAWWRTALGAVAASIAVGRLLPTLTHGTRWPYALLGVGYGLLALAVLAAGLLRQHRTAQALRRGEYSELSDRLVVSLTCGALALAILTLVIVVANF